MTIYRGPGGTGEARTDTDVTEVRIIADEAEGYKDAAAASAVAAASSASAASTSETNAQTAETNAETAETNAETAQAAAEFAQAAAEAAQLAAEAAQTAAELAETNAETAEANAETAETNAETAQAAAEAALASAQAVYDNFDDRYLGAKSSNPTLDNDGNALLTGALYFNTVAPEMRVYSGSAWQNFAAASAVSSFNTRTGAVTLSSSDVTTALGYTPVQTETDPVYLASSWYSTTNNSSNWNTAYGWGNHASAGYATDSAVVKLTGDQTVAGTKTFSSTITGSISGNAGTVTNGIYTTGSYADPTWLTSLAWSKITSTPTTILGYGITNAYTKTEVDTALGLKLNAANPSYTGTLTGGTGVVNLGSGQFYKDASGNVGIGTASPADLLDLAASNTGLLSTDANNTLRFTDTDTSTATNQPLGKIEWYSADATTSARVGAYILATAQGTSGGGNLEFGTATNTGTVTEQMQITGAGDLQFNSGYGSVATAYGCRAWVNFNGTGTPAIRASGNVQSITDNGVGDYTVVFENNMPDVNYSFVGSGQIDTTAADGNRLTVSARRASGNIAVGSLRIVTGGASVSTTLDPTVVTVAVFR